MKALLRSSLLAAAFLASPTMAQQAPKPLVDNDKVRAYESVARPGVEDPMRERPARVVRALRDGTMQRIAPDGKTETVEWKTGEVRWYPRERLAIRNTGKQDAVFYIVEVK
jgi:hypothetical protein